jgi:glutamine amidotransferase
MCRLYGFRANDATKVECTLVLAQNALLAQSQADLTGISHPDGWGIAYYEDGRPLVERRAGAAFADLAFSATAARVDARTVVAHVRKATVSGPALENTHPFQCGPWVFAHNGTLTGFDALRDRLRDETSPRLRSLRRGETDSETIFFWLLSRFEGMGIPLDTQGASLDGVVEGLRDGVRRLMARSNEASPDEPAQLNLMLTDGEILVVSRLNRSLHTVVRRAVHDCEICGLPHPTRQGRTDYRAVVVASEPISHEDWQEVPQRSIVAVDAAARLSLHPF